MEQIVVPAKEEFEIPNNVWCVEILPNGAKRLIVSKKVSGERRLILIPKIAGG